MLRYFLGLLNSLFLFCGVPTLLQQRWLPLSVFWEHIPNRPADDHFLYPWSASSLLPSLWLFVVFLEFVRGSLFPLLGHLEWSLVFAAHNSLLGSRVFISNVVFQYFIFIRLNDFICVKNDDRVHHHVLSPSSAWFLWLLQHWETGPCSNDWLPCGEAKGENVVSLWQGVQLHWGKRNGIPGGWQEDHGYLWEKEQLCCSVVGKCGCL